MHWNNKYGAWAVVTGASDGIGQQMAIELAKGGPLNLLLVARRSEILERLAARKRWKLACLLPWRAMEHPEISSRLMLLAN